MGRVRLRHLQAEELIAKAKEQAVIREQQLRILRAAAGVRQIYQSVQLFLATANSLP